MAVGHENRTHQGPLSRPLTGFEDRAGHQIRRPYHARLYCPVSQKSSTPLSVEDGCGPCESAREFRPKDSYPLREDALMPRREDALPTCTSTGWE